VMLDNWVASVSASDLKRVIFGKFEIRSLRSVVIS